jgi:hypothetical protein
MGRYGVSPVIQYIDRSEQGNEPNNVLLDPTDCVDLIEKLRDIQGAAGHFVAPDSGDAPLSIEIAAGYRSFATVASVGHRSPQFRARLLTPLGARALAPLDFEEGPSTLTLRPIAVERLMELQAASGQGLWIELHHETFRLLGPLPDLLTPGSRTPCAIDPVAVFRHALGGSPAAALSVPGSTAVALARRFGWLACPDPVDWRLLLEPI